MDNKNYTFQLDNVIKDNSKSYLQYYVLEHYPSAIDGLKTVHRRVIYALRKTHDLIPSKSAISQIGRLHEHSDDALYQTFVRMSRWFFFSPPLTKIGGNGGSYSDPKAHAAVRYTSASLSDFSREVFIYDTNFSTLRYKNADSLSELEPKYLIPKIPVTLLYNISNIGYGHTSRSITFKFEDVCNLAINYIKDKSKLKGMYKELYPYFHGNVVMNFHEIYDNYTKDNYQNGEMKIYLESEIEIVNSHTLRIKTIPFNTTVKAIEEKLLALIKDKNTWFSQECSDYKNLSDKTNINDTNMVLIFKRSSKFNIFEAIDKLKGLFTDTFSVYNNFQLNGTMVSLTVEELIATWYKERKRSIISDVKQKITRLTKSIDKKLTWLVYIKNHKNITTILRKYDPDDVKWMLADKYNLTQGQVQIIYDTTLRTLLKTSEDEIRAGIEKDTANRDVYIKILKEGIDEHMIYEITSLRNSYTLISERENNYQKFKSQRDYNGLLMTNKGYVLIEDMNDIKKFQKTESSQLYPVRYIPFNKNDEYLLNKLYTSKKNSSVVLPTTKLNTKYSLYGTLILDNSIKYTVTSNNSSKFVVNRGIISINKYQESEYTTVYASNKICIIDNTFKLHMFNCDDLTYDSIGVSINNKLPSGKVISIFAISDNDSINDKVLYFIKKGTTSVTVVPINDTVKKIQVVNSKKFDYLGAGSLSNEKEDTSNVIIYNNRWYDLTCTPKINKHLSKGNSYMSVALNELRIKE